mmetsp:Transcript_6476/g.6365  ORF Transcript_6476/g.6365 Transcript_6476/m.6365 type:complete len:312 (-) Transcript_6476:479-1414(-)
MSGNVKDDNEVPNYRGFDEGVSSEVQNLARSVSRLSTDEKMMSKTFTNMSQVPGVNPMSKDNSLDPRLDPDSDDFDSRFWVKNLRKMYNSDPAYYKPSSLGVAYKDLRAYGIATDADYQANFANAFYKVASRIIKKFLVKNNEAAKFDILKPMDGLIRPGEVTVVLGRPGAGCSTFLKTISSHTYGFNVDQNSTISYDGLTPHDIINHFRGDVVYCAETESHFPQLTVGQTLEFAAKLRTPQNRPEGVSREEYAAHMTKVIMATYGLSHTKNTKVGNDFIRGVSGGERKRVSRNSLSIVLRWLSYVSHSLN